jgi:putative DNA primase/helicase
MANLAHIFGGSWSPPAEPVLAPPEQQLQDAMRGSGLEPPDTVYLDGKIHRFKSGTKGTPGAGDKSGWYIAFSDGIPAGRFGCWRAGLESTWRAEVGRQISPADEMAFARRMAEAKAARDIEQARKHEVAADVVDTIWSECIGASPDHPYLKRKGITQHGARVTGDGRLVVPLYDQDGTLSSLQYIDADGGKLYHPGGQTGGKFWWLGSMAEPGTIYVAEGFATAATIRQATDRPVVVAYSASNLVPVTATLRARHPTSDLVIVADNDKSGVGQRYAEQACAKHGARMVMPPAEGDANDYAQAGGDLLALLTPPVNDWLVGADLFSAQPSPVSWLVKNWLQADALIMVHGPSGGGKTFAVLDWVLHLAAGHPAWQGHKVKPCDVVYLAGEGHQGLRGRIAAWKHHNHATTLSMWLSKSGCDLNTTDGYQMAAAQIRSLPRPPGLIVVDTLHRFLAGDENSSQDVKTMLDACAELMREFRCSVILVHHTGVSDEAQHRARGSSAWRGALDIEISIVPPTSNLPMQIIQRKSKDAELAPTINVELQQVTIPGWLDEDGQPVTSAVLVPSTMQATVKTDSKLAAHRKTIENAWWASGTPERKGQPFIERGALMEYLIHKMGISEASARVYIRPSADGKLIAALLVAQIIESDDGGWIVSDPVEASAMMIRKKKG